MIGVSDHVVAIGGGEVARDELIAAKSAGKHIHFIAADMNHRIAIERAAKRGEPPPADFRGAAAVVFGNEARAKP
jgi:threonine dehydratase